MVSIPSIHFFRWTSQLENAGHEVFWFDITGMGSKNEKLNWVSQKTNWKLKWNFPGRIFIKNKFSFIYNAIQKYNENNTASVFEAYLKEIQPDAVHSFALYLSCSPIMSVMEKYPNQKWIYSSWGSDLYYFQNEPKYLKDIKRVLSRVNYLFTDCYRDFQIAQNHGFKGQFLGVFPGGGGFDLTEMQQFKQPKSERKIILIKGFQGRSGRAIPVLKAIELLQNGLLDYSIVVFGADAATFKYIKESPIKDWNNFQIKGKISHLEVVKLMGQALIYVGNSNSDGIPNTLLEAICMEVFPIQSNPGGATAEVINHGINGLLIENCEDSLEIKDKLNLALKNIVSTNKDYSQYEQIQSLDFSFMQKKVLNIYDLI